MYNCIVPFYFIEIKIKENTSRAFANKSIKTAKEAILCHILPIFMSLFNKIAVFLASDNMTTLKCNCDTASKIHFGKKSTLANIYVELVILSVFFFKVNYNSKLKCNHVVSFNY